MKRTVSYNGLWLLMATAALLSAAVPAQAQDKKPNILFIMGDDIGWMQPGCYHRGLMVGETPNIDRIANEGAIFMTYYAEQSCTAGRNAFFTGMNPLRTGMIPPHLPDASAPGDPVHLLRWHGDESDVQGRRPAHAGAVKDCGRGNLFPCH